VVIPRTCTSSSDDRRARTHVYQDDVEEHASDDVQEHARTHVKADIVYPCAGAAEEEQEKEEKE
jgi:hypothetical protein